MPQAPARTRRKRSRWPSTLLCLHPKRHVCLLALLLVAASCLTPSLEQSDLAASAHAPPTLAGRVPELVRVRKEGERTRREKFFLLVLVLRRRRLSASSLPLRRALFFRPPKPKKTGRQRPPQATTRRGAPETATAAACRTSAREHLL